MKTNMKQKNKFTHYPLANKSRVFMVGGMVVIVLFFAISLVRNVARVSKVKQDITNSQLRIENLRQENEELKEKIAEAQSQTFIEKQMRDKLGLAKEGEVVIVLPEPEILRMLAPQIPEEEEALPDPNWRKWYKLFF